VLSSTEVVKKGQCWREKGCGKCDRTGLKFSPWILDGTAGTAKFSYRCSLKSIEEWLVFIQTHSDIINIHQLSHEKNAIAIQINLCCLEGNYEAAGRGNAGNG